MNMEIKVLDTEEARDVMIVEVENVRNMGYEKLSTYQGASKLLSYEVSTSGHAKPSEGGCGHGREDNSEPEASRHDDPEVSIARKKSASST